jgi:hypothetical protein
VANNACFVVKDANGFAVSYVYFGMSRRQGGRWCSGRSGQGAGGEPANGVQRFDSLALQALALQG